jgi:hypothetical protein
LKEASPEEGEGAAVGAGAGLGGRGGVQAAMPTAAAADDVVFRNARRDRATQCPRGSRQCVEREYMSDEKATQYRNAMCDESALLIAYTISPRTRHPRSHRQALVPIMRVV